QMPGMRHDIGVRDRALNAFDARVVRERIAVVAEEPAPRFALREEAMRADVAMLHVDVAVREAERRDDAVAVERVSVAAHGRKLLIGADAEEGALELARHLALDLEIEQLPFETERLVDRHERRAFRKRRRHGSSFS